MDLSQSVARTKLSVPDQIARPSPAAAVTTFPAGPYVTHCRTLPGSTAVVAAGDDGSLTLLDKATAAPTSRTTWDHGRKVTALDTFPHAACHGAWATAGSAGVVAVWDPRALWTPSATMPSPRAGEYLSVAVQRHANNASGGSGALVAAGSELHAGEAAVDIFDLRQPVAPLFSYTESHSDDVTTLAFYPRPERQNMLLSGSSDGLAAVYDLAVGSNEDDAVVAVGNTGASLAKAGWGGAQPGIGRLFIRPGEEEDKLDGLEEEENKPRIGLGGAWTVSDMQTVGIWDADRFDAVLEPMDAKQPSSTAPAWETDYVVDAFDVAQTGIEGLADGLVLFTGDQAGGTAMIHVPAPERPGHCVPWTLLGVLPPGGQTSGLGNGPPAFRAQGHSDIVRCLDMDPATRTLTTGGEDGRLCIWSLENAMTSSALLSRIQQSTSAPRDDFGKPAGTGPARPVRGGFKFGRGSAPPRDNGYQSRFKPYG